MTKRLNEDGSYQILCQCRDIGPTTVVLDRRKLSLFDYVDLGNLE